MLCIKFIFLSYSFSISIFLNTCDRAVTLSVYVLNDALYFIVQIDRSLLNDPTQIEV